MTPERFAAIVADPALTIAKYADEITDAVMKSIGRATIDQGPDVTLDARLWVAVRSGVAGYLSDEIAKAGRSSHRRDDQKPGNE
jgi:hypothetical protein